MIQEKAFGLARKYLGDPLQKFGEVKSRYDHDVWWNEKTFIEETLRLIDVTIALDDMNAARDIQKKALVILDDSRLRDAIPAGKIKQKVQPRK